MVLNKRDCDRVFAVTDEEGWGPVEDSLKRLVETTKSGLRLFGSCWKALASQKVMAAVQQARVDVEQSQRLTRGEIKKIKDRAPQRACD